MKRRRALPTLAVAAILALPLAAAAQAPERPGDAGRGAQLAQERCASCHVVAPGQQPPANAAPPNFAELAKDTDGNMMKALEAMEESRHPAIPGGPLERQDLRDIAAHISELDTAP